MKRVIAAIVLIMAISFTSSAQKASELKYYDAKNQFWIDLCARLNKEGYRNIKVIDLRGPHKKGHNPLEGSSAGLDGEGTVDGGHLTDLGFQRLAEYLYPFFRKIKD